MTGNSGRISMLIVLGGFAALSLALGQTAAPAAPAAKPAAKPLVKAIPTKPALGRPNPVDDVIKLVKSGMSEQFILRSLQAANKPVTLSTADLLKLKEGGVSEAIIGAMMDPKSAAAPPPPPPAAAAPLAPSAPPPPPSAAVLQAQKKRVAVVPFDYSAVMTSVQSIFNTQANIGDGIRAMVQTRLTQDGKVVVVERGKIDTIMKEQDNAAGNRMKAGSGPRIGRISGADAILAGDIVTFGRDDKKKGGGGGMALAGALCRFCAVAGAASAFKKEEKAVVVVNYRLIDAETSEILDTGEARGESSRTSKNWGAFAAGFGGGTYAAGGAGFDMTSSNFAETIIGEATKDAVDKISAGFVQKAIAMKKRIREVEAQVADVSGNTLVISAGGNDGVNSGETFEIFRVDREVKDPSTKEILDRVVTKVGEMTVSSVRDKIATGSYIGTPASVGMVARKKM